MISQLESTPFSPPAKEVCEGYVFTGVCLSTGGWGVCSIACWDTPPGRHPWAKTPLGRHPPPVQCMLVYGQQAGGSHPTGMYSWLNVTMCHAFKIKICLVRNCAVLKKLFFSFLSHFNIVSFNNKRLVIDV